MKARWIAAVVSMLALLGAGCDRRKAQTITPSAPSSSQGTTRPSEGDGRVVWVDPATIQQGPIRHETLSAEQMARIKKIHRAFAEVDSSTLEQCVDNFKRDADPDRELTIWERMVKAYQRYTESRSLSLDAKKEVFKVVLLRSMAPEDEVLARLKLSVLTRDEAIAVMRGY